MIYKIRTAKTNNVCFTGAALSELIDAPKAILWNNAGLYRVIPIQAIRNCIRMYNTIGVTPSLYWSQALDLPIERAKYIEEQRSIPL